jgi:hypothetical protein
MAGKLVICVKERQSEGFFLAPYDLEQKKFVGPVRFIYERAGKDAVSSFLQEAIGTYAESELAARVDGATEDVFKLCLEYGVMASPSWRHYNAPKR